MNYNTGQFDQTTGHQSQEWPNSPLIPNPNPTPGLDPFYYGSEPLPPAGQHQPPHPFSSASPLYQYPTHITPNDGSIPPSQYAQYAPQPPYGQQLVGIQQYLQQYSQQYTQQQPIDTPQAGVASPQPNLQWQLQQWPRYAPILDERQFKIYILPTPPSPGYDESQNVCMQHIDTTADIKKLQAAMEEEVCGNTALIQVLTDPKYQDPRALHQLKTDYERKTNNILAEQIASKTDGDFKVALLALLGGPLDYDVYTLQRALFSEGIEALNDVLLCRSNADIGAILNKYESTYTDSDLVQLIASKVDNSLFRLYNLILSGTRAEDEAPAIYAEIEEEAATIYRLTNGSPDMPTTPIVNMLASANIGQLRAMSIIYDRNYGKQKLDKDISEKFSGCMKETLLRILHFAVDSGDSDLTGLCNALTSQRRDIFIYRALRLYWSGARRLQELHTPSMRNRRPMETQLIYRLPNGDFRELMIALIGEKSTST
ncbi:hypothetical protein H0G86_013155 [Trichoderma simmonsii]|uniref:Annexin n=1 Tax=Trichoderma simmonsii TaxID=1491479 RepID=A0A8G0LPX9_9HYPO|nr:hypothetical protein H0G86_013155 [Trichoderma simmonsii]